MSPTPNTSSQRRLLRLPDVLHITGMSRAWTYEAVKQHIHPAPCKVGRASVWDSAAIDQFVAERIATSGSR